MCVSAIPASQARAALPEILDRVLAGEEVTITRHGKPVAVVVRPDTHRSRRADQVVGQAERLRDLIEAGRSAELTDGPSLARERAELMIEDLALTRDAR